MVVVDALLDVTSFPDDDIAEMAADFWHRLARHLTTSFSSEAQVLALIQPVQDGTSTHCLDKFISGCSHMS